MKYGRWAMLGMAGCGMLFSSFTYAGSIFGAYQSMATGSRPEAVAIGDVTGDGRNDVVLVTSYYFDAENDYKLFVFAQNEDGTLAIPVKYATAGTPTTVAIGDLNGDGRNDVAVGNKNERIQVFKQKLDGTLVLKTTLLAPYSSKIRIGDLNDDGLADVAGIGWGGSDVGVFLQDSAGSLSFSAAYPAPHGGFDDLELGDINADGMTDIVVMSGQLYIDNFVVLKQLAGGGFGSATRDLGGNELTQGVGVGDVTGDGRDDVVVSFGGNRPSSHIAVFAQSQKGYIKNTASILPSYDVPEPVEIADMTGDGRADVVVLHGGWMALGVYTQNRDGTLADEERYGIPYATHYNPHGLAIGDINGDGALDVAIADYNHGLVILYNTLHEIHPPVADAGGYQETLSGQTVTLDGSGSADSDGKIVKYSWAQVAGPAVELVRTGTRGVVTFIAPDVTETTRLVFRLRVTDDEDAVDTDKVVVRVYGAGGIPPKADAGADGWYIPYDAAFLDGTGSTDADGTIVKYVWTQVSGPAVVLSETITSGREVFLTPYVTEETPLVFRLKVVDDDGNHAVDTVTKWISPYY